MADPEHLTILRQGGKTFNGWREENPVIMPNLINAELSGEYLREANLSEAHLIGAYFGLAYLSEAKLIGADLRDANLSGARLSKADLSSTDLRRAILREADLSSTDLREANLSRADLSKAVITGADLRDANLFQANLSGADLREANLSRADLRKADLRKADLRKADLSEMDLIETNLSGADLSGADLSMAKLNKTNLSGSDLNGTIFRYTEFAYTILGDTDLSDASELENTFHSGPSIIGIDTIFRSEGKIPHIFLKNAGVPDKFIEHMGSWIEHEFQFYSCFISYSNNDKEFAERIYADLRKEGVRCWFAPKDMKIGDKIRQRLDESIRIYDKLLLVLSENSIASTWVEKEVETAFEKETRKKTVLFPVSLDDCVMETDESWAADIRKTRHIGDFINWKNHDRYQQAFKRLLRDLQAEDH